MGMLEGERVAHAQHLALEKAWDGEKQGALRQALQHAHDVREEAVKREQERQ